VRIPVIEMVEIGAGGGSIAHVDALKRVTVGPESAGSEPGPACYRRGGMRPTVTDADVALGMIDPAAFAGGTISLNPDLARAALATAVGDPLGMSPETAAYAVHEMVCENMASAARVHAVERGETVSDHTLIAFGGAAPLHAARVAEKLGVARVLVPPNAGVGSAVGFLVAPISYELVKSRHMRLDDFDFAGASALLAEMSQDARALVEPGARGAPVTERRTAYMRYVGQGHEIMVPLPERDLIADDANALRDTFEREYSVLFRRPIPGAAIEALSWSVLISTQAHRPDAMAPAAEKRAPSPDGSRAFYDGRAGSTIDVPVYSRSTPGGGRARARARRSSPRTRRRHSSPQASTRASTAPGVS
jgi:N-methylhydantoinase A